MTIKYSLLLFILCTLSFLSCNPDCDSLSGLQVTSLHASEGDEVLVTANPPSSLKGRNVFFNDVLAESRFEENHGLLVTIPAGQNLNGQVDLRVEDPDCVDFVSLEFNVEENTFFESNAQYVFPTIPEIIIPNLPTDFPPSIENAWLSPVNPDYCFWITLLTDSITGECIRVFDTELSFEQSTCYQFVDSVNPLYNKNHVSGYIDENDRFYVTIHRPDGPEHFEGGLVNPMDVPEKYREWQGFACPPDGNPGLGPDNVLTEARTHMLVLTSQRNGKQMFIYQQEIALILPTCE